MSAHLRDYSLEASMSSMQPRGFLGEDGKLGSWEVGEGLWVQGLYQPPT